ncbi:MAG: glycosyltransferase family 39 protein [Desulfomonile tiedjei]|uniref:Glycosyltransferase family 39 protein n=1 Tax=Desulfomonile tiedjei TaxID=2358 RepID=A0A9D6V2B2_9BACT|nr:glycosyltransferase family 39 protein [Desulfomonile tiedjei]
MRVGGGHRSESADLVVVALISVICLVPFVYKAFHVDDTLFLWAARQIQLNPTDFYGFTANWYGREMPMSLITRNPPLNSYFLAGAAWFFGWSELALHLAFLVIALALGLGTYFLAARMGTQGVLAVALMVVTPAFLVSSTNVMCDTLMLALYVWTVVVWSRGLAEDRWLLLMGGAILASLAALTKYHGMTLVPLLAAYSLVAKRRVGTWALFLVVPVGVFIAYECLLHSLYGAGVIADAASWAATKSVRDLHHFALRTLIGLSFTGGSLISVAFFAPLLWSRKTLAVGGLLVGLVAAALVLVGNIGLRPAQDSPWVQWGLVLQMSIFVVAGIHVLALAVTDITARRDADSLMLFLWTFGTFVFGGIFNWTTNVRSLFPMAPAAGILVARRLDLLAGEVMPRSRWAVLAPLLLAACCSMAVAWADFSLANCQKVAAQSIAGSQQAKTGKLWFQGHWGFQYYMQSLGASPVDFHSSQFKAGDVMVIPMGNASLREPRADWFEQISEYECMPCRWVTTSQRRLSAGFYSDGWGWLPFAFGPVEAERFLIFRATRGIDVAPNDRQIPR